MKTNIFWSEEDKSIRGSFVNLSLTFVLSTMIIVAIFLCSKDVINNIKELQGLIIWFYGISFGLWSGKKAIESIYGKDGSVSTKINNEKE